MSRSGPPVFLLAQPGHEYHCLSMVMARLTTKQGQLPRGAGFLHLCTVGLMDQMTIPCGEPSFWPSHGGHFHGCRGLQCDSPSVCEHLPRGSHAPARSPKHCKCGHLDIFILISISGYVTVKIRASLHPGILCVLPQFCTVGFTWLIKDGTEMLHMVPTPR